MSETILDGSGVKRLRILDDMGEPDIIECDGMTYEKVRTASETADERAAYDLDGRSGV